MEKEYYYVYCKGVLGVKTNICDFKWVYGSVAPAVSSEEYEKCVVKFNVCVKPEKHLSNQCVCERKFQAYSWDAEKKMISYHRRFFGKFEVGYRLQINENTVNAEIGLHYYKYVRSRIMNLHGVYYLLSDLANVLLLKNGFLTLYASAVYFEPFNRCAVNFAPPNTGKTYMATTLCEKFDYRLVGEDIVIFDGCKVYSCPWTNSYRKPGNPMLDSSASVRGGQRFSGIATAEMCTVTDLTVLSLGDRDVSIDKNQILKDISMLNGYLFHYYSSPIVKILGYFDEKYHSPWEVHAEALLKNAVDHCYCYKIQSEESVDFAEIFHEIIFDKKT